MLYNFKQFQRKDSIYETVDYAKSLLLRLASDEKRKKMRIPGGEKVEFTPEEQKEILNNPKYIEVRDYLLKEKKPGYIGPFTYFSFVEGLPMECGSVNSVTGEKDTECFSIVNLKKKLDIVGPMLQTFPLPLGTVENYIKEKIKNNETYHSYERLWDDITNILSQKPVKEFVDQFVGPVRQEFSRSLKEQNTDPERKSLIDRLYHAVTDLKKLKPLKNDKTGEDETAEEQLIAYGSKYKDTRTYPEFKDTFLAFKEFVRDCEDKVSGWGTGIDEFIEELRAISPSIKILYYNAAKGLVVTAARSGEGMRSVCKIANASLCIRNDSTFWRYTSGQLQISFSSLKLPKTNPKYLTSFTVNAVGKITDSANRENMRQHTSGENYVDFIKRYGIYDEGAVEAISKNFNSEITIKNIIESIEKKSGGNKMSLLGALGSLGIQKAIEEGDYTQEEMNIYRDLIVTIIKKDNKIGYDDMVKFFLGEGGGGGFYLKEDIELFEIMSDYKYNKEDVRKILDITIMSIPQLESFLKSLEGRDEKLYVRVKYVIDYHPTIREYVETKML